MTTGENNEIANEKWYSLSLIIHDHNNIAYLLMCPLTKITHSIYKHIQTVHTALTTSFLLSSLHSGNQEIHLN